MPFSAVSTPDTLQINIQSGSYLANIPGSVLNLDYLQLKSQPLPRLGVQKVVNIDNVVLYPNPANDRINITGVTSGAEIVICDMMGRVLSKTHSDPSQETSIPVGNLPRGMYVCEISCNNGNTIRTKFIKE